MTKSANFIELPDETEALQEAPSWFRFSLTISPANDFLTFLEDHYDLSDGEKNEIALQLIEIINKDGKAGLGGRAGCEPA